MNRLLAPWLAGGACCVLSSDQASFIQRGVPALAVGATRTAEARPLVLDWQNRRYHAPGDDLEQPLDFAATARYARALFFIARAMAQADERPRWNPGNFYGERFGTSAASLSSPRAGDRQSLRSDTGSRSPGPAR